MSNPHYEIGTTVGDERPIPDHISQLEASWNLYCEVVETVNRSIRNLRGDSFNRAGLDVKDVDSRDMEKQAEKLLHAVVQFCTDNLVSGLKLEIDGRSLIDEFIKQKLWYSGWGKGNGDRKRPAHVLGAEAGDEPKKAFNPTRIYDHLYEKFCGGTGRTLASEQLASFITNCRGTHGWQSYKWGDFHWKGSEKFHEGGDSKNPILPAIERFKSGLKVYKETVVFKVSMTMAITISTFNGYEWGSTKKFNEFLSSINTILKMSLDTSWSDYDQFTLPVSGGQQAALIVGETHPLPNGSTMKLGGDYIEIKFKKSTWEIIEKFLDEHHPACKKEREQHVKS